MENTRKSTVVTLTKIARDNLRDLPREIVESLFRWKEIVETEGLQGMRGIRGYRDEKLRGTNQWSCRLNRAYRLYYHIGPKNEVCVSVIVTGVDKHRYGK